jgi:hypothetical protein
MWYMNIYITHFSQIALAETANTRRNISELQAVVAVTHLIVKMQILWELCKSKRPKINKI